MTYSPAVIVFIIFLIILIAGLIVFVFCMNNWLCFSRCPNVFQPEYKELESPPVTEEDEEESVEEISEFQDVMDAATIAATETGVGNDGRDDDNDSTTSNDRANMYGQMWVTFGHQMTNNTLYITISKVENILSKSQGGCSNYEVCIAIFDSHGNKLKKSWSSPMFKIPVGTSGTNVQFPKFELSDLSQKNLASTAVRLRLYGCERKRRNILLSETIVGLATVRMHEKKAYKIRLEQRAVLKSKDTKALKDTMDETDHRSVSIKVENEGLNSAELIIGLAYNLITGRMTLEIVKGNSFTNPLSNIDDKLPNSFVKITISVANNQEIEKTKTTIRENQANPLFKEKFMFHLPFFQLNEATVMIAVYHRKSMTKKALIGWFSLGLHNSSDDEKSHWQAMLADEGNMVQQTHLLQQTSRSRGGVPGAR